MSTTLTNGLKLPDKGSVDWYADMQSNYSILDGAVGTIAEHTSQIAGKAPAVHTHTKADITDFPAYGNTAGTICEGNDSRLSDARTPVAHTHTKSDITNLFNSANSWTENNTYAKYILMKNNTVEIGNAPSNNTSKEISFTDKNNETLSRLVGKAEASGNSYIFLHATNKYTNEALDPNGSAKHSYFYVGLDATGKAYNKHAANTFPDANNTYDLGSSSYQWNNLYAKNYYYNGVAWGLDQANVWTGQNTFNQSVIISGQSGILWNRKSYTAGTLPASTIYYGFQNAYESGGSVFDRIRSYVSTTGTNLQEHIKYAWNDLTKYVAINYWINADGSDSEYKLSVKRVIPGASNTTDLGTSTNKWKSLNGVNPGALSFPNYDDTTYIDISGSIVPPSGQTTINYSGGENQYTPPVDGWLSIRCDGATFLQIYRNSYNCPGTTASRQDASGKLVVTLPVLKNNTYTIKINTSGTTNVFQLYPCLGNV